MDVAKGLSPDVMYVIVVTLHLMCCCSEDGIPEITALEFMEDGLTLGVGTSTGQVLMYDVRSTKPVLALRNATCDF